VIQGSVDGDAQFDMIEALTEKKRSPALRSSPLVLYGPVQYCNPDRTPFPERAELYKENPAWFPFSGVFTFLGDDACPLCESIKGNPSPILALLARC